MRNWASILKTVKVKINLSFVCFLALLFTYLLSQLPFLTADAALNIAGDSRGAWTDEGLYTCQIRNFIHHGRFDILDGDAFLKSPLLSFSVFPFFKVFGTSLSTARLIAIFFSLSLLLIFLKNRLTLIVGSCFIVSTLMLFPIHQYGHLCLAEIFSSLIVVVSILVLTLSHSNKKYAPLIVSHFLLLLAVLFKIQYIYILILPLLLKTALYLFNRSIENINQFLIACILSIIILMGIFSLWYLPFRETWKQLANFQSGRISLDSLSLGLIWWNIKVNLLTSPYIIFTLTFISSVISALYNISRNFYTKELKTLLLISFLWFTIELHKLCMVYLPVRYLISFYMSMGIFIAVVMGFNITQVLSKVKSISLICLISIFLLNIYHYQEAYSQRTFVVQNINNYFKKLTKKEDVVIGPWAPSFNWESQCYAYPIWNEFLGDRNIKTYYKPDYIVSEYNQEDSDTAYKKNNIILDAYADSITQIKVALWKLNFYRVKRN
jgi:hypothetical protein